MDVSPNIHEFLLLLYNDIIYREDLNLDQTSKKSRSWTFRKTGFVPKFTVLVRNLFLTNFRMLILTITTVFSNSRPKHLNKTFSVP